MTCFYLQCIYSSPVKTKQVHIVLPRCLCTGFAGQWELAKNSVLSWHLVWDCPAREAVVLVGVLWLWITEETSWTGHPATGVSLQSEQSTVLSVEALDAALLAWVAWTLKRVQPPLKSPASSHLEVEWWISSGESWNIHMVGEYELNFNCPSLLLSFSGKPYYKDCQVSQSSIFCQYLHLWENYIQ